MVITTRGKKNSEGVQYHSLNIICIDNQSFIIFLCALLCQYTLCRDQSISISKYQVVGTGWDFQSRYFCPINE
jgi:hypothetical protein